MRVVVVESVWVPLERRLKNWMVAKTIGRLVFQAVRVYTAYVGSVVRQPLLLLILKHRVCHASHLLRSGVVRSLLITFGKVLRDTWVTFINIFGLNRSVRGKGWRSSLCMDDLAIFSYVVVISDMLNNDVSVSR